MNDIRYSMIITADDLRNISATLVKNKDATYLSVLSQFVRCANYMGMNYIFIDRDILHPDEIDILRNVGYNILIGQGDKARIKISW